MCQTGVIPERTSDPGRAFHLWSSDGAAILTTNRTDPAGVLAGAREVFGPRLIVCQSPATVDTNMAAGQDGYLDPVIQTVNADVALDPHIDGYTAFGNHYPDLVFQLCEQKAAAGGESFIVDGQRILGEIAGDPTQRALSRFLWDVTVEQSQPPGIGPAGTAASVRSRWPVASRTCAGRLTVRRHHHQRLLDDAPSRPQDRAHLAAWAQLTREAARTAPRFTLQPGELLCLDNYRVFQGREPCFGYDRTLHRLWAWTDMAFGLPRPGDLFAARGADTVAAG
ncbi:MAG: TauD/TfdA family dioxygenase [Pseudonocardiaceae bacterium]